MRVLRYIYLSAIILAGSRRRQQLNGGLRELAKGRIEP